MAKPLFSIAITTNNRAMLVGRAIESAFQQGANLAEVIVVDDASTDSTAQVIAEKYPMVRYLVQEKNRGCCAARNRALREAEGSFVIILDDDDTLKPGALSTIEEKIRGFEDKEEYPVFQFAHETGTIPAPFMNVAIRDYINGNLKGDFLPVIHRMPFLKHGFAYPEIRSAGEHLLWWEIAEDFGIPTWAERICDVHQDAPIRLTSPENQVAHAADYAELQETTLVQFGNTLLSLNPREYLKRLYGAATYRMLSGDRRAARVHLHTALKQKVTFIALALWVASGLPVGLIREFFVRFRRMSAGSK